MTLGSSMSHSSSKTRMSALEKLKQSNAAKLELENRKMEERIRSLKEKMMKEKEERELLGGTRWISGRTGPLKIPNVQKPFSLKKTCSNGSTTKGPRKVKVLIDEPITNYLRKPKPKCVNDNSINYCGQCENSISVWVCRECSENYCDACFDQFHQKGALTKHSKTRIEKEVIKKSVNQSSSPKSTRTDHDSSMRTYGEATDISSDASSFKNGESLLSGSYNEADSAASFAQALQEWRKQDQVTKSSPIIHLTSTDTACGTSNESVNQTVNKKEVSITFHPSMSYGDRLFLKKGRENPSMSLEKGTPRNLEDKEEKRKCDDKNDLSDSRIETDEKEYHQSVDHFSPNYREMIQSMATPKTYQEDKNALPDLSSKHVISIREVTPAESNSDDEKGVTCIVEECGEETRETKNIPTSQRGRVSILEMSPTGNFSERSTIDLDNYIDSSESPRRYVSSSITSKPFHLMPSVQTKTKKPPTSANSAGATVRKQSKKVPVNKSQKMKTSQIPVYRTWKPKPNYKELSEFFLAGVEEHKERPISADNNNNNNGSFPPVQDELSHSRLSSTWHPHHSYLQTTPESPDMPHPEEIKRQNSFTSSQPYGSKNVRSPGKDNSQRVPITHGASEDLQLLPNKTEDSPRASSVTSERKAEQWSNEDDELQKSGTFDVDDFGIGNQDDDDRDTLNELAWELASSTGRLTRCEEDSLDLDVPSDDIDSIEDKESGSGLSTPNTLERSPTFHENLMDDFEEMERKFMEEEF